MSDISNLRQNVLDAINKVRTESGREPVFAPRDNDTLMGDLGLDSLDLAVLVVSLEKSLGVDPFREQSTSARTFGEVVEVYRQAVGCP